MNVPAGAFGPLALERGYRFRLYAPAATSVDVVVDGRTVSMARSGDWFSADDAHAHHGSRYAFVVDGAARVPDPGSRFQPDGVHADSAIVDPHFAWPSGWNGRPWHEHVVYELHVGTFTFEGTYAAAAGRLDALVELGVTAIELMPLAAFPGQRNWGYDGVYHYAPFSGYGSPHDLKRLIAAAHERGLAVLLDVVYNHFGPEGNYLPSYAPAFFNESEHTPWGAALDMTVPDVRAYFIENAIYWIDEFRFDGLRLDAVHAIVDPAFPDFLRDLSGAVHATLAPGRQVALVVENDDNAAALLTGAYDAQWNDDVHHCAHVVATGESGGYYRDYVNDPGGLLSRALATGFAYQGEPSIHREGRRRGDPSAPLTLTHFVNFLQNHDQIGNRAFGERLSRLTSPEALHALAALVFLAPSPPLLFMGEEWAASTPFLFFCDFEPELAHAVTDGRRREFASFPEFADEQVRETIPDPSAPQTFAASVLRWEERSEPDHARMLAFTRSVLAARHRAIVPIAARLRGVDASVERIGEAAFALRWDLGDGALHADANLTAATAPGFAERLTGKSFFTTHGETYRDGIAPPWSVRWTRT
jgi:maltooligosyltrehalose trehalohydrolase